MSLLPRLVSLVGDRFTASSSAIFVCRMVQRWITDRKSGKAVLVLLPGLISCWLLVASMTGKAAPVNLPSWPFKSSLVTGNLKYPVLYSLCAVGDNIRAAIPIVTEEQERIHAEQDAFDAFIERVQAMDTDHPHSAGHLQQMSVPSPSDTDQLQQVRDAYEDTVMAVPHYEEDYDDTIDESMSEEFSQEIAVAVNSGQQFSAPLKRQLLQAASTAREWRTNFLSTLDQEQEALTTARTTLTKLEEEVTAALTQPLTDFSIDELLTLHDRLRDYEQQCEAVLKDRQRQRTDGHATLTGAGSSYTDLQTYLYRSLSVTYPVLADGSTLQERLQTTRHRMTTELAWRY